MANPINEQIALRVKTRMETITTLNGYEFTATVEREDPQRGNSPANNLLVVCEDDEFEDDVQVPGYLTWMKPFTIKCYAVEQDGSATNLKTRANKMAADVYKAVTTDYFWDNGSGTNLALNTFIRPPVQAPPENGGVYAVEAVFHVQYRHSETNPYSLT